MKIKTSYIKQIGKKLAMQLQYMECDAYACYESYDSSKEEFIIGSIPSETLSEFKKRHAKTLFLTVCDDGKKLIAMACISKVGRGKNACLSLHTLYVKPYWRNCKFGTSLLQKAIEIAKSKKMPLTLKVNPLNKGAWKLYEKLGFVPSKCQNITMELNPSLTIKQC